MSDLASPRIALVTGARGGIGQEVVKGLVAQGFVVYGGGRDHDQTAAAIETLGARAIALDPTSLESTTAAVEQIASEHGAIHAAAHCVGSLLLKPAHLTSAAEWDSVMLVNLTSAFYLLRSVVPKMTGGGSIALVSSVAAQTGLANHEAIAAAKAGISGLARSAAASYASRGIRVNAIAPGLTQTPLTSKLTSSEAALKASIAMHPLGRLGTPSDIAAAICFLLSSEASWVTGQVIGVDGGLGSVRPRG